MDINETAKIIALAKLFGLDMPSQEILDKYYQYHQEALKEFAKNAKPNTVEVIKRLY